MLLMAEGLNLSFVSTIGLIGLEPKRDSMYDH